MKNYGKHLDLKEYIPKYIISKKNNKGRVVIESMNNKIIKLKYITKSSHKHRFLEYNTIIPRKLPLNKEILNLIGLMEAEMNKSRNNPNITFYNTEPDLVILNQN